MLVIGASLVLVASLSGFTKATHFSTTIVSVAGGLTLAAVGVLEISPGADAIIFLVELALVLTLFADGLIVERELLKEHWHAPTRALVVAAPLTLGLIAVAAHLLFPQLSWAEALLVGAVLMPTDPVVTSNIVTAQHVPPSARHALNIESGLNDGLALPFVLFFLAVSSHDGGTLTEGLSLLGETAAGAAIGAALGTAAALLLRALPERAITGRFEGLFALGLALAAFGAADFSYGNGLVAAFVAAIPLAVGRHEIPMAFRRFNENLSALFEVITFLVFGALVFAIGFDGDLWRLLAFILVALLIARPLAVLISFVGVRLPRDEKLFVAWFGPKGVASILFALFVLNSVAEDRRLTFQVAAFTILASILLHGATETVGSRWLARRSTRWREEEAEARDERPQAAA